NFRVLAENTDVQAVVARRYRGDRSGSRMQAGRWRAEWDPPRPRWKDWSPLTLHPVAQRSIELAFIDLVAWRPESYLDGIAILARGENRVERGGVFGNIERNAVGLPLPRRKVELRQQQSLSTIASRLDEETNESLLGSQIIDAGSHETGDELFLEARNI